MQIELLMNLIKSITESAEFKTTRLERELEIHAAFSSICDLFDWYILRGLSSKFSNIEKPTADS